MLQSITVRNFKLFDEQGITFAPSKITVFIGANGTGKSSIFQALQLLKQNAESAYNGAFQFNGHELSLGSFADIVHNQALDRKVEIAIDLGYANLEWLEHLQPRISRHGVFTYTIELSPGNGFRSSCAIHDDHHIFIEMRQGGRLDIIPDEFSFAEGSKIKVEATGIATKPMAMRLTQSTDSHEMDSTIQDIQTLFSTVQIQLTQAQFTPAIRGFDQLDYEIYSSGARNTNGTNALLRSRALANMIAERPDIAEEVGQKTQQVLGIGRRTLRNRLAGDRVAPEMGLGRNSVTLFNEAFGLNQLIPAMVDLVTADQGALVAIEEPEAHLHPRAQAALADTLVDFALNERKQVMLTTHSEHILMSLLGAVASSRLQPGDLAVYELYREGDAARTKRLTVNQYGQIEGGLREFMEVDIEKVGELVASRFR